MQFKRFAGFLMLSASIMISSMVARPLHVSGQTGDDMAKFKKNVVHLTVKFSDDSIEQGFGFVVGEQDVGKADNVLYVATANHVVRQDNPDVTIKSIKAQFCTYKLKSYSAELLEVFDADLDFALLEIQKPFPKFRLEPTSFDLEPAPKTDAWFIGLQGECLESGVVKITKVSPKGSMDLLDNQIQPGTSGAPLISNKGIAGLITRSEPGKALVTKIEIIQQIAQEAGVPWGLSEFTATASVEPTATPTVKPTATPTAKTTVKPTAKLTPTLTLNSSNINNETLTITLPVTTPPQNTQPPKGWFGVMIQPVTPEIIKQFALPEGTTGALVEAVLSGGSAEEYGIRRGDVIVEFDSKPIDSPTTLKNIVAATEVGTEVKVVIFRSGEKESILVKIKGEQASNSSMELVWVPGGKFLMGCGKSDTKCNDDEKPAHTVRVDGFWMGKYEVTQSQWQAVMGNNPSDFRGADRPVEQVPWNEVQEFLKKLNATVGAGSEPAPTFRLPSEAEWEYAARAGTQTVYSFGDDPNQLGDYAWYNGNSNRTTLPVGQKRPNDFNLYDMHGNVLEWCQDTYASYRKTPTDGNAYGNLDNEKAKVLRGGSYGSDASDSRSGSRFRGLPEVRNSNFGFRVVAAAR